MNRKLTQTELHLALNDLPPVLIPEEAVAGFKAEMEKTGADCLFVTLPTALHGFSNTLATTNGEKYGLPLRYDARADAASWNHLQLLLVSAFSRAS